MVKRKKKLLKGVYSIERQIKIHNEKLKIAKESKDEILQRYYEKEIESLKFTRDRKKKQFAKSKF